MSAINVIRQSRAVSVLTDAAAYTREGKIIAVAVKCWPLPHLNAVAAFRGPLLAAPLFVSACLCGEVFTSYDDMRDRIAESVRHLLQTYAPMFEAVDAPAELVDVVIAGWSETRGADSFIVCNHTRYGVEPFTVVQLSDCSSLPGDVEIQRKILDVLPENVTADQLDPERDGLKILEVQRAARLSMPGENRPLSVVGGFAQLTSIEPNGTISTRVIHRWADAIGTSEQEEPMRCQA
jgi:hypothetical protein